MGLHEILGWDYGIEEPYIVFSLTWPAYMQIYWNKRKRLHKKRVQLPEDLSLIHI